MGSERLGSASELKLRQVGARAGAALRCVCLPPPPFLAEKGRGIPPFDHFPSRKDQRAATTTAQLAGSPGTACRATNFNLHYSYISTVHTTACVRNTWLWSLVGGTGDSCVNVETPFRIHLLKTGLVYALDIYYDGIMLVRRCTTYSYLAPVT